jgi:hypothetical protein
VGASKEAQSAGVARSGCFGRARNQEAISAESDQLVVELGGFLC